MMTETEARRIGAGTAGEDYATRLLGAEMAGETHALRLVSSYPTSYLTKLARNWALQEMWRSGAAVPVAKRWEAAFIAAYTKTYAELVAPPDADSAADSGGKE